MEGIKVKGKGCPKPIKTWAQCGVSKKEMDILKKLAYEKPTPIQTQTIPAVMSGTTIFTETPVAYTAIYLVPIFSTKLRARHYWNSQNWERKNVGLFTSNV